MSIASRTHFCCRFYRQMTSVHHIPGSSAHFVRLHRHEAWNSSIFGIDAVLEPASRNTGRPHDARQ